MMQSIDLQPSIDDILDCYVYAAQNHTMAPLPPTTDESTTHMSHATPITIAPKEQDYKALRPLFGWLSMDII